MTVVRSVLYFLIFLAALFLLQFIAAWAFGSIGYVAQYWLEFFAARDMQEVAIIAAMVITIGGFVAVIVGINRVALWWRMRRIRRLSQP
ncbi:MAG: hypothetical protein WC830_22150 [Burkholderiales bacterium]